MFLGFSNTPYGRFSLKADEYIEQYKRERQTDRLADVIADVILELKEFFGVSLQAAKIRMIDIGYTEAIGAYEYVGNRYVPVYSFRYGAIGRNQTFSIPIAEALIQYAFNDDFRRVVDSGDFIYINSHYCINHPEYIAQNEQGGQRNGGLRRRAHGRMLPCF